MGKKNNQKNVTLQKEVHTYLVEQSNRMSKSVRAASPREAVTTALGADKNKITVVPVKLVSEQSYKVVLMDGQRTSVSYFNVYQA